MNPLVLADSDVSRFCLKNRIFEKLNSWTSLSEYLERSLPSSVLQKVLYVSEKISNDLKKTGFSVLSFFDPEYPSLLREIYDPPLILFYKGDLNILELSFAAVVGTRDPSPISCYAAGLIPSYLKKTVFRGSFPVLPKESTQRV